MDDVSGAPLSGTGSHEPSPDGLGPSGFDPSRWRGDSYDGKPRHLPKKQSAELNKLLAAAREHIAGLTPYRREMLAKAARSVSPINCGWQQYHLAEMFVYELHRDTDGSPEGRDAEQLDGEAATAGAVGIAQTSPEATPHAD